jgi:hypothetical protein
VLARLACPGDQGVTAVAHQADRPVVLVDVGEASHTVIVIVIVEL